MGDVEAMRMPGTSVESRTIEAVLSTIAAQADGDARVEDAKQMLPSVCSLQAVFNTLDRRRVGFVTDMGLSQFMRDGGKDVSFSSIGTLIREVQLRQPAWMH